MNTLKQLRVGNLLISILIIIMGLTLIITPTTSSATLCYLLGVVLFLAGLVTLVILVLGKKGQRPTVFDWIGALVALVFGILLVLSPLWFLAFVNRMLGLFVLAEGLLSMWSAIKARKDGGNQWLYMLGLAVVMCLFGIMMLFTLFATNVLMVMLGISLILLGIRRIFLAAVVGKVLKSSKR